MSLPEHPPAYGVPLFFNDAADFPEPLTPDELRRRIVVHMLLGFTPIFSDSQLCDNTSLRALTPKRTTRYGGHNAWQPIDADPELPTDFDQLLIDRQILVAVRDNRADLLEFHEVRRRSDPPNLPHKNYVKFLQNRINANAARPWMRYNLNDVAANFKVALLRNFASDSSLEAIGADASLAIREFVGARDPVLFAELLQFIHDPRTFVPSISLTTAERIRALRHELIEVIRWSYDGNVPAVLHVPSQFNANEVPKFLTIGERFNIPDYRVRTRRGQDGQFGSWVFDPVLITRLPASALRIVRGGNGVEPLPSYVRFVRAIETWRRAVTDGAVEELGDFAVALEEYCNELNRVYYQEVDKQQLGEAQGRSRSQKRQIVIRTVSDLAMQGIGFFFTLTTLPSVMLVLHKAQRDWRRSTTRHQVGRMIGELRPLARWEPGSLQ